MNDARKRKEEGDREEEGEAGSCGQCRLDSNVDPNVKPSEPLPTFPGFAANTEEETTDDEPAPLQTVLGHHDGNPFALDDVFLAALSIPEFVPDSAESFRSESEDSERSENIRKTVDDIVALTGDPSHLGSFVAALQESLVENPVVLDYVPDAAARLGIKLPEDDARYNDPLGTDTLVIVSFSLGDDELKTLFERNAGKNDTRIVFRGIPDGMRFADGVKHIQGFASRFDPMLNVVIDPRSIEISA